jgi:dolichol-phosphate mannosyltransferase
MDEMNSDRLLSIILLSYQSEKRLASTSQLVIAAMETENIPFELIIMDDGSKDHSFEVARSLATKDARIRAYRLSRNFTSPYAQFAGMSLARGACVVSIPDDLQRPLSLVIEMYRLWEQGQKIVIAYRKTRDDGKVNDFFSNTYYKLMNAFSEVDFPPGGTDGFLADREVVDILNNAIHPRNTSSVAEVLRLGFQPYFLGFDRPASHKGRSRWTLRKKLGLAMDTFFGSSSYPLRLITLLGFIIFFICLLLTLLIIWAKIFTDNTLFGLPVQGWATLIVIVTMFNGLILLCLGIVSEYIWRIHEEVKGRPGYIIRKD